MVADAVKRVAVRMVKPRVSPTTWRSLKRARTPSDVVVALRTSRPIARTPAPAGPPRPSLTALAEKYRTDKWGAHKYTPHYEHHFTPWRTKRFTLFEIGIGPTMGPRVSGASLRMWREFFPRAQIVGLDIDERPGVADERIDVVRGSQDDPDVLRRIMAAHPDTQLIIDDGSHRPEHIRATFAILFPLLADGGIYAIEDTQTSYWPEWGGSEDRADPTTTLALVKDLLDGLHYEEFVDIDYQPSYTDLNVVGVHVYHNLVFIEKGRNVEGTRKRSILRARYAGTPN